MEDPQSRLPNPLVFRKRLVPEVDESRDELDPRESDYIAELEDVETLFNGHLRRLRNFYAVLAEVCQRDQRLLGF